MVTLNWLRCLFKPDKGQIRHQRYITFANNWFI